MCWCALWLGQRHSGTCTQGEKRKTRETLNLERRGRSRSSHGSSLTFALSTRTVCAVQRRQPGSPLALIATKNSNACPNHGCAVPRPDSGHAFRCACCAGSATAYGRRRTCGVHTGNTDVNAKSSLDATLEGGHRAHEPHLPCGSCAACSSTACSSAIPSAWPGYTVTLTQPPGYSKQVVSYRAV